MHHVAKITLGRADYKPYNIQCSCGTGGDFGGKEEAASWMAQMHFRTLGGVNTYELQDITPPEPEVAPAVVEPEVAPAVEEPKPEVVPAIIPAVEEDLRESAGDA